MKWTLLGSVLVVVGICNAGESKVSVLIPGNDVGAATRPGAACESKGYDPRITIRAEVSRDGRFLSLPDFLDSGQSWYDFSRFGSHASAWGTDVVTPFPACEILEVAAAPCLGIGANERPARVADSSGNVDEGCTCLATNCPLEVIVTLESP